MGKPKKRTTRRKTRQRRTHLFERLASRVNAVSPVKAFVKKRQIKKAEAKAAQK